MEFRSSKQKHQPMGRPPTTNLSICKKHPKHQQSPGVCSVCLNERLSKLSTSSRSTSRAADSSCSSSSLSSLTSSHYSASASSCSSPVHHHHHHHRHYSMALEGKLGFSMTLFKSGKNVLAKSRSVASGVRRRDAEGQAGIDDHGKKKNSFWSKLLRPKNKKIDAGLPRSRTTNAWVAAQVLS